MGATEILRSNILIADENFCEGRSSATLDQLFESQSVLIANA
jgi:hypothetical protein